MHWMILIADLLFIVGRKLQGDQNPAPHHHQERNGTRTRVGGNTTSVCAVNVIPPNGLAGNGWSVGIAIWPQPRLSLEKGSDIFKRPLMPQTIIAKGGTQTSKSLC